jgi:signal peptidase II
MKPSRQTLVLSIIILGNIILDQLTKLVAIETLKGEVPHSFLGNFFRLEYIENSGAFLGMGAGLSDPVRFWVFSILVGFFIFGLIAFLFRSRSLDYPSKVAFAFVAGGGLSNLIDRLFRDGGRVVDFMNVGIGPLRTGIFNVADMAILFAVIWLFLSGFRKKA